MISYKHTGLQRIKKLVPDLTASLDLNHLFVVQPALESEQAVQFPGLEPVEEGS
jgi:non-ribosomal peptide synthetase component F